MNRMFVRHKHMLSLRRGVLLLLFLLLLTPVLIPSLLAETGVELVWWTIDGGGGTSSGDGFTITGTIGQPDAGTASNGTYTLLGGFWPGPAVATEVPPPHNKNLYLPLVLKQ